MIACKNCFCLLAKTRFLEHTWYVHGTLQFLSVCEEHLAIYLKERDPKELSDVVKLADTYLDARLQHDNKEKKTKQQSVPSEQPTEKLVQATNSDTRSENLNRRACFHCHQTGHIRKHCALYHQKSK